ncbi:hypothetical protein GCM10007100_34040 [Roseibacillus persicicus]|uniref:Uncharacterized protein n=1 Tax=Roseibacillus persicicus TaxID=454148 RepID=A0A918TUP3_9BACT|nr:hypothetical protein GCM10007100_34040 [Roseibacillus persicicus]
METYDKHLKGNKKVALIHVSYDRKDSEGEKWAVKERMTWPTIQGSNREASGAEQFSNSDYIPEYQLIDATGKVVAPEGKEAIAKAVELAAAEDGN